MGKVAGVVVGGCSCCGGRIHAQGQRWHPEGIFCCGIGAEPTEVLFWHRTRGHCIRQLPGQAKGQRRGECSSDKY